MARGMNDGKLTASGIIVDGKNAITATTHIPDIKEPICALFADYFCLFSLRARFPDA